MALSRISRHDMPGTCMPMMPTSPISSSSVSPVTSECRAPGDCRVRAGRARARGSRRRRPGQRVERSGLVEPLLVLGRRPALEPAADEARGIGGVVQLEVAYDHRLLEDLPLRVTAPDPVELGVDGLDVGEGT